MTEQESPTQGNSSYAHFSYTEFAPADTLGWHTVLLGDTAVRRGVGLDRTDYVSANYTLSQYNSLRNARNVLLGLNPDENHRLGLYLAATVPQFFLDRYAAHLQAKGIDTDRAGTPVAGIGPWLADGSSDELFSNFLQWNVHRVGRHNADPGVDEYVGEVKKEYEQAVNQAIGVGWLSPDAQRAIDLTDAAEVIFADPFDTIVKLRAGYCENGQQEEVFIAPAEIRDRRLDNLSDQLREDIVKRKVIVHELNHAVLGSLGDPWLTEALTEHIALSLIYGDFGQVSPLERDGREPGTYIEERKLLDTILNLGREKIGVEVVTTAYSSKKDSGVVVVGSAFEKAWGGNLLADLNDRIAEHIKLQTDKGVDFYVAMGRACRIQRIRLEELSKEWQKDRAITRAA